MASKIFQRDIDGENMETKWEYASIIWPLNFLEKSTRPDFEYAVHKCARFTANPKSSHKMSVLYIGRYLIQTKNEGISIKPNDQDRKLWCNADFCGN